MNFIDILMVYYRVVRENEMFKAYLREIILEKYFIRIYIFISFRQLLLSICKLFDVGYSFFVKCSYGYYYLR